MSVWRTCPECKTNWYSQYTNGVWIEGYCQHCSFELKTRETRPEEERWEESLPKINLAPRELSPKKNKKDKKSWMDQ